MYMQTGGQLHGQLQRETKAATYGMAHAYSGWIELPSSLSSARCVADCSVLNDMMHCMISYIDVCVMSR